jgi:hypothetical protein
MKRRTSSDFLDYIDYNLIGHHETDFKKENVDLVIRMFPVTKNKNDLLNLSNYHILILKLIDDFPIEKSFSDLLEYDEFNIHDDETNSIKTTYTRINGVKKPVESYYLENDMKIDVFLWDYWRVNNDCGVDVREFLYVDLCKDFINIRVGEAISPSKIH